MSDKFNADDYYFLKFMEQFLTKREYDTRRNIASISSVCETLANGGKNLSPDDVTHCLNMIMTSCCSMMKTTELYTKIITALFNSDIVFSSFDLNKYMKVFCSSCNETLGSTCKVDYVPSDDIAYISTNNDFFEYILLGSVRRSVISGARILEISSEKLQNNDIVITFRVIESDPAADLSLFNDIDLEEFVGINTRLAEKINSHFSYESGVIQLKVDYRPSDGIVFNSPEVTGNPNTMTPFHSMLADISGYEFY